MTKIKVLYFSIGFVIGFISFFLIAVYFTYFSPNAEIYTNPKKFGDIAIVPLKDADGERLIMTKGEKIFFYAEAEIGKTGKVINGIAIGDQNVLRFKMAASEEEGKWKNATYACCKKGRITGEEYTDINFDGQFDIKAVYDDAGKVIATFIYVNKNWKKVDQVGLKQAISRSERITYIFDSNSGWLQSDANSPDKHGQ